MRERAEECGVLAARVHLGVFVSLAVTDGEKAGGYFSFGLGNEHADDPRVTFFRWNHLLPPLPRLSAVGAPDSGASTRCCLANGVWEVFCEHLK